ncbi:MAG: 5'/3'-nucleotidase SurE [Rhizobiales bacterium]|nr:5'/3'-nucleotidase SurE [Hyphomicrobiales bacterium]MBI3673526.1 5'/3'-nucleotidase SurE [Hyphomicrobiales bacterium]
MRILVTNDDGIHAPGLLTLERIARTIADDVWIVAPAEEQSGAGHSLSLADPIRYREIDERRFEVAGTPTDCVVMAVRKIMPGLPDLVLSGVNRGQNIADDVTYSGTIAAAMEGTTLGLKSIALSQVTGIHGNGFSYAVAEHYGANVVQRLMDIAFGPGVLMNVNFPDCRPDELQGIEVTRQGKRDINLLTVDERVDARGRNYYWLGFQRERGRPPAGTDLNAVFNKRISVTPLHMNLTQIDAMEPLRRALEAK